MASISHVAAVASAFGWGPLRKPDHNRKIDSDKPRLTGKTVRFKDPPCDSDEEPCEESSLMDELLKVVKEIKVGRKQANNLKTRALESEQMVKFVSALTNECAKLEETRRAMDFDLQEKRRASELMKSKMQSSINQVRVQLAEQLQGDHAPPENALATEIDALNSEGKAVEKQLLELTHATTTGTENLMTSSRVIAAEVEVLKINMIEGGKRLEECQRRLELIEKLNALDQDRWQHRREWAVGHENRQIDICQNLAFQRQRGVLQSEEISNVAREQTRAKCSASNAALRRMIAHFMPVLTSFAASLWWTFAQSLKAERKTTDFV